MKRDTLWYTVHDTGSADMRYDTHSKPSLWKCGQTGGEQGRV